MGLFFGQNHGIGLKKFVIYNSGQLKIKITSAYFSTFCLFWSQKFLDFEALDTSYVQNNKAALVKTISADGIRWYSSYFT